MVCKDPRDTTAAVPCKGSACWCICSDTRIVQRLQGPVGSLHKPFEIKASLQYDTAEGGFFSPKF